VPQILRILHTTQLERC